MWYSLQNKWFYSVFITSFFKIRHRMVMPRRLQLAVTLACEYSCPSLLLLQATRGLQMPPAAGSDQMTVFAGYCCSSRKSFHALPLIDLLCWFVILYLLVSVKEVRNPGSESESSDVEARSTGEVTPPSTPGTIRTEKKSIGRSASVASSGPFVATPEWVSVRNILLRRPSFNPFCSQKCQKSKLMSKIL